MAILKIKIKRIQFDRRNGARYLKFNNQKAKVFYFNAMTTTRFYTVPSNFKAGNTIIG